MVVLRCKSCVSIVSKHSPAVVLAALLLGATAAAAAVADDWKAPDDGHLTEQQVSRYLTIAKGQQQIDADFAQAVKDKGAAFGAATVADYAKRREDLMSSNGMSSAEFNWVGDRLTEGLRYLMWDRQQKLAADEQQGQLKAQDDRVTEAKAKLAAYTAAQKDNRRVMTDAERAAAVESAKGELASAQDDAKSHADAAKTANDEAAAHDAEAKAADAAAASPPADLSAEDKPGYVEQKKADAQTARDAAKDARDRAAGERKAQAESDAKAVLAQSRIDHPDVPLSDDEKAQVRQDDQQGLAEAQTALDQLNATSAALNTQTAALMSGTEDLKGKVSPGNLALLKAHLHDYVALYHLEGLKLEDPATQPAGKS